MDEVASSRGTAADAGDALPATLTFLLAQTAGPAPVERVPGSSPDEPIAAAVSRWGGRLATAHVERAVAAAFPRASDALAAAVEMQQAEMRAIGRSRAERGLRIGLHTGEAVARAGELGGAALDRAARLCSLAWPGQTLLSQSTFGLVGEALPEGSSTRDLGTYVLEDPGRPERVYELRHPGLTREYPPLRAGDRRAHNLPLPKTSFVGRAEELSEVERLLRSRRLVTLTGPGGCGKTRLALEVARRVVGDFEDGVYVVALATVVDPALTAPTIAHSLGVRESREHNALEGLTRYLADKELLLLLDNFERVVAAAGVVAELLDACPRLRVLVTSRAALRLSAEQEVPLAPLGLPRLERAPRSEDLAGCGAIRLFVDRAQAVNPRFELTDANAGLVAEICERLDGLPLAIELAAVRLRLLPLSALAERLRTRLDLLRGGARDLPARQQTLRSLIDWDYELLQDRERRGFRALSVFPASFTVEGAARVLGEEDEFRVLDELESLVGKSLLRQTGEGDEPRFAMMQTIRERGLELLRESGEAPEALARHAAFLLDVAKRANAKLRGPEQAEWLERLEIEHDNLRAALRWASEHERDDLLVELAAALADFWTRRGHLSEGWSWCELALARSENRRDATRAHLLRGAGTLARGRGDYDRAERLLEECLSVRRDLGDDRGVASALRHLGTLRYDKGDVDGSIELTTQSLELRRKLGDQLGVAKALNNLGVMAQLKDEPERALELYEQSAAIFQELYDKEGIARSLMNQGAVRRDLGQLERAGGMLRASLELWRELGDVWDISDCLEDLAGVECERERWETAATLFGAADGLRRGIGAQRNFADDAAYRARLQAIEAHLDEATLRAAWNEGGSMGVDDIVAYARKMSFAELTVRA